MLDFIPSLPIASWVDDAVKWVTNTFEFFFDPVKDNFGWLLDISAEYLSMIPPVIVILLVAVLAFFMSGKKLGLAVFSIIGLLFIENQELWSELMYTFTLVLYSSLLAVVIGIPVGILMSKSNTAESIIRPILDFMQTMPAFVYLIPAVAFFGIGMVPGVFASFIFATPPVVRFTNLGIRQVSTELVEASDAFGATGQQKLFKVELPMAKANDYGRSQPNNYVVIINGCYCINDRCIRTRKRRVVCTSTCGSRCWFRSRLCDCYLSDHY